MLYNIKEDLWFDNEKLYIISGDKNKEDYIKSYGDFPECNKVTKKVYPTIIFISSTNCNLRCTYCYANAGTYNHTSKKVSFTLEDYIEVYKKMKKEHGKIHEISFFGGEPLLNFPAIKKFVTYLEKQDGIEEIPALAIASNGTIMNSEIKGFLKKYNVGFCTSLDGPKTYNDKYRVGTGIDSVFDKVENTLNYLSDLKIRKAIQFTIGKEHVENYVRGDFFDWSKKLENLDIDFYEVVPVMSENKKYKIDLNNEQLKNNFTNLCNNIADHCLKLLINGESTCMPKIFTGIILSIAKRQYQEDCGAGDSISVTPDKKIYPCHICADDEKFAIPFEGEIEENKLKNNYFQDVKKYTRDSLEKCNQCIAKNICPYFCKGILIQNGGKLFEDRCLMMEIFTKKTIEFLENDYDAHKNNIKENMEKILEYSQNSLLIM